MVGAGQDAADLDVFNFERMAKNWKEGDHAVQLRGLVVEQFRIGGAEYTPWDLSNRQAERSAASSTVSKTWPFDLKRVVCGCHLNVSYHPPLC